MCWLRSNVQHQSKMKSGKGIGLYGKLPSNGDFIFRNLTPSFINPWDEWLQHFISGSKEQIGGGWLDIYLTSPIWQFVFSPGVIDSNMWAGLMMPSVDRVGRYFPISIVKALPPTVNPANFMIQQSDWYQTIEKQCLMALEGKMDADSLIAAVNEQDIIIQERYQPTFNLGEKGPILFGLAAHDVEPVHNTLPYMLNALLMANLSSYSLWWTSGSTLIEPMIFCCQGLPPIAGIASMLDGQWQQRNWKIPYNIKRLLSNSSFPP